MNDSNFVPDLLVGLPTGGVHAANKLSGALSVLKGEMPLLWYTRPQAVKEESKAIFDGVDDSQKFREQELSLLVEALKRKVPQGQALKILIVDDGAVSGQTLR